MMHGQKNIKTKYIS